LMAPGVAGATTSMLYVQWLEGTSVVLKRLVVVPPELPLATPALPPVQKPLMLLGDAITSPPVRLSVKVTPVRVTVVLGLLTSKVMVDVPPGNTLLGANCFVATG